MKLKPFKARLIFILFIILALLFLYSPLLRVNKAVGMISGIQEKGGVVKPSPAHTPKTRKSPKIKTAPKVNERNKNTTPSEEDTPNNFTDVVNDLAFAYPVNADGKLGILVATNKGLYRSYDLSKPWEKIPWASSNLDSPITCISTNERQPTYLWVGTITLGVRVSTDTGITWRNIQVIPTTAPIRAIRQDPQRPAYIYVGTNQTFYYSHDGGERWIRRGGNLPYGDYAAILINPQNGNEIFVGNAYQNQGGGSTVVNIGGGVYHSTDAGLTWRRIDPDDTQLRNPLINSLTMSGLMQNTLYAGTRNYGIFKISRGDDHPSLFSLSHLGDDNLEVLFIYGDRERPLSIYAGTYSKSKDKAFFLISNDGGKTWQPSMSGLNISTSIRLNALLQDPRDANVLYLGTNRGVYRSLDRGLSWRKTHVIAPDR